MRHSLIFCLLLIPDTSFAGKCVYNIPIRVDSLFSKKEVKVISKATRRWTRVSSGKICFNLKVININKAEALHYREDGLSTIYSGKDKWQQEAAAYHSCVSFRRCIAFTVTDYVALSSDIFIINSRSFYDLITHELGHLLGMKHSRNWKDIMFNEVKHPSYITAADRRVLRCLIKRGELFNFIYSTCTY
jgi:hypothetical protein